MENKEYNKIERNFTINAGEDSSAYLDMVIADLIKTANESNSIINFKVELIRTKNMQSRKNNLIDEIILPIVPTSKPDEEEDSLTTYIYARILSLYSSLKNEKHPNSITADSLKLIQHLKIFNDAKNSIVEGKENSDWKEISNQILETHYNKFVNPKFKENLYKQTEKEII